jgi:hypothetical protein
MNRTDSSPGKNYYPPENLILMHMRLDRASRSGTAVSSYLLRSLVRHFHFTYNS